MYPAPSQWRDVCHLLTQVSIWKWAWVAAPIQTFCRLPSSWIRGWEISLSESDHRELPHWEVLVRRRAFSRCPPPTWALPGELLSFTGGRPQGSCSQALEEDWFQIICRGAGSSLCLPVGPRVETRMGGREPGLSQSELLPGHHSSSVPTWACGSAGLGWLLMTTFFPRPGIQKLLPF